MARRTLLGFGLGVAVVIGFGLLLPRSNKYADGARALARVATLRPGLMPQEALDLLHAPNRVAGWSWNPVGSGWEQMHALTNDRYVVLRYETPKGASDPVLHAWAVRAGHPAREDVMRGTFQSLTSGFSGR